MRICSSLVICFLMLYIIFIFLFYDKFAPQYNMLNFFLCNRKNESVLRISLRKTFNEICFAYIRIFIYLKTRFILYRYLWMDHVLEKFYHQLVEVVQFHVELEGIVFEKLRYMLRKKKYILDRIWKSIYAMDQWTRG